MVEKYNLKKLLSNYILCLYYVGINQRQDRLCIKYSTMIFQGKTEKE